MRKLFYSLIGLCMLAACQREAGFRIQGLVPGTPDGMKAYLYDESTLLDSSVMKDGRFLFRGKVDIPAYYSIWIDLSPEAEELYEKDMRGSSLFVDNSDIQYECASIDSLPSRLNMIRKIAGKVTVTGSATNDLYIVYLKEVEKYANISAEARDLYLKDYHIPAGEGVFNTRRGIELMRQMKEADKKIQEIQWDFIKRWSASPVALEVANRMVYTAKLTRAEMDELLQSIDTTFSKSQKYQQLKEILVELYPIAIGGKYTDLELNDTKGETVHLSDYIKSGQYNMVEFWASWCGPCRYEIPHLRHVYEAYGKDGLNMVSVSLDDKDEAWKEALKEENMKWTQLCDQKGWAGEVATKYHIRGVPFSLILDGEGKIIDYDVRGSELDIILINRLGDRFQK